MPNQSFSVIGDFFYLTHVQNPGAAFSIGFESPVINRVFFSVVSFLMIFVILYMLKISKSICEKLAYALIVGGAIGNLIDRVVLGSVTDFFDFDFFTINIFGFYMERWPVFNIADSSIVIAMVLLVFYALFLEKRDAPEES